MSDFQGASDDTEEVSHSVQSTSGHVIDCATVHDMVHDYVLARIDPADKMAIERHCSTCPRCRDLVADLSGTASLLAFASRPVAPPLTAKAALFARIAQSATSPAEPDPVFAGSLDLFRTPTIPAAPVIADAPGVTQAGDSSRDRWSRIATFAAPLATVPLLLALGFVGYWSISTRMELNDKSKTVTQLNSTVQLLNSKVDEFSVGMEGFDEYLNPGTSKHYAMLDPSPPPEGARAYGLLMANPLTDDAVIMAWKLDPTVDSYEVVIELSTGEQLTISDLYTYNDGDAMKTLKLGVPLSEIASVHVKPKSSGISTDSQIAAALPDALYATIWPGLGGDQDTFPIQSWP